MTKYYHGTNCKNIPSIKEKGLLMLGDRREKVHMETFDPRDATEERIAEHGVFLVGCIEDAWYYGYDASKDCPAHLLDVCDANLDAICVVEVDLDDEIEIGSDGYGSYMTKNQNIPPKYITKIYRPDEMLQYP